MPADVVSERMKTPSPVMPAAAADVAATPAAAATAGVVATADDGAAPATASTRASYRSKHKQISQC